jgi:hypothetical protein
LCPHSGGGDERQLGYVVEVAMKPLDLSKVPDKYKHERKSVENGQEVTTMPLESATYKAKLTFILKDGDGFTVATLESKEHFIASGQTTPLQDMTASTIVPEVLRRTKHVTAEILIETCESCYK